MDALSRKKLPQLKFLGTVFSWNCNILVLVQVPNSTCKNSFSHHPRPAPQACVSRGALSLPKVWAARLWSRELFPSCRAGVPFHFSQRQKPQLRLIQYFSNSLSGGPFCEVNAQPTSKHSVNICQMNKWTFHRIHTGRGCSKPKHEIRRECLFF